MSLALRATAPCPAMPAPVEPARHLWPSPADGRKLTALDWRLYWWCVHLARTRQDMPRDARLAEWLGFAGPVQVDKAKRSLEAAGLVEILRCRLDGPALRFLQTDTAPFVDVPQTRLTLLQET